MFCMPEIRRPRAETRKKAEIRIPKGGSRHGFHELTTDSDLKSESVIISEICVCLRPSGFAFGQARTDFRAGPTHAPTHSHFSFSALSVFQYLPLHQCLSVGSWFQLPVLG